MKKNKRQEGRQPLLSCTNCTTPPQHTFTFAEGGAPNTSSMCLTSKWYRLAKKHKASSDSRSRLLRSTFRKVDARSRNGTWTIDARQSTRAVSELQLGLDWI